MPSRTPSAHATRPFTTFAQVSDLSPRHRAKTQVRRAALDLRASRPDPSLEWIEPRGGTTVKWKQIQVDSSGGRTFVVVADQGDEALATLEDFAHDQALSGAQITAVGAFTDATVGWYDRDAQDYRRIRIDEQCEVLSIVGDVALSGDQPQVHVHAVLGLSDGTVRGGHLLAGHVWPTLEVVVRETPTELYKTFRPEVGLALIDLDETGGPP